MISLLDKGPEGETEAERRARRRRTRWMGSEHDKTFIPGLPTVLPSTLTKEQEEQYLREYLHLLYPMCKAILLPTMICLNVQSVLNFILCNMNLKVLTIG